MQIDEVLRVIFWASKQRSQCEFFDALFSGYVNFGDCYADPANVSRVFSGQRLLPRDMAVFYMDVDKLRHDIAGFFGTDQDAIACCARSIRAMIMSSDLHALDRRYLLAYYQNDMTEFIAATVWYTVQTQKTLPNQ